MKKLPLLLAGVLLVGTMTACNDDKTKTKEETDPNYMASPATQSVPAEEAGMKMDGNFKPAEFGNQVKENFTFPYIGANVTFPQSLKDKIEKREIFYLDDQNLTKDGKLDYAFLTFSEMSEEQRNAEISKQGDDFVKWLESLKRVGTFGIFPADMKEEEVAKLTGLPTNEAMGNSKDGKYTYYRSYDASFEEEMKGITITPTERKELPEAGYAFAEEEPGGVVTTDSLADIETTDIQGKTFTGADFGKYDLTMVNVFATWCSPCVQEIPELEKLHKEMKDKGVNLVGMVLDTKDDSGDNKEAIDKAKAIQEKLKATYSFLKPDDSYLHGRVANVQAVPETFFVDKEGNIVGKTYSGAKSYEEWKAIVEEELANVKK